MDPNADAAPDMVPVPRAAIEEAIWAISWCVDEHDAPDPSREKKALAGLRKALRAAGRKRLAPSRDAE